MNIYSIFDVSAAGMNLERMRLEVSAINLANADATRGPNSAPYVPLQVVVHPGTAVFDRMLQGYSGGDLASAAPSGEIAPANVAPHEVYEPGHPHADARGFVSYPGVDPVSEMVQLISITRAYEANVRAFNAGREMAMKALQIGSGQ